MKIVLGSEAYATSGSPVADVSVALAAPVAVEGLGRQTRAPHQVLTGTDALARATRCDADWVWMLGHGANPRDDALAQLLAGVEGSIERPATLIAGAVVGAPGAVVGASGAVSELQFPGWDTGNPDLIGLVAHRLLPIRHTHCLNCLVKSACLLEHGLPNPRYGPFAATEWSARVIRDGGGYFAPLSIAEMDVRTTSADAARSPAALIRMFRAGVWTRGDALTVSRAVLSSMRCQHS